MGSKRKFNVDFKKEAVIRIEKRGTTKASEKLGIASSPLSKWRREQLSDLKEGEKNKPSYEELEREGLCCIK